MNLPMKCSVNCEAGNSPRNVGPALRPLFIGACALRIFRGTPPGIVSVRSVSVDTLKFVLSNELYVFGLWVGPLGPTICWARKGPLGPEASDSLLGFKFFFWGDRPFSFCKLMRPPRNSAQKRVHTDSRRGDRV